MRSAVRALVISVLLMGLPVVAVAPAAAADSPPANTVAPVLSGSATVGSTLSVTNGTWSGSPTSYYYNWQDCNRQGCTAISPANNQSTYVVKSSDVGDQIEVTVTAYNSAGSNYANSNLSATVTTPSPPSNTSAPVLSGSATLGSTLSVTTGSWTGSPTSYYYNWQDCNSQGCTTISPANNQSTYVVKSSDVGDQIVVTVTAYNATGNGYANSNRSSTVSCSVAYPSVLHASGQQIVNAAGCPIGLMKGFNVQPGSWAQSNYNAMATKGAKIVRTVVFWDQLEPTQGQISSTYVTALENHIAMLKAAGLYTTLDFYFGPNGSHEPTWAGTTSQMSDYITYGQMPTQYLAQLFGQPSSPYYTPAVTGFGINEPTPDCDHDGQTGTACANPPCTTKPCAVTSWVAHLMSQENTMTQWFRAYAPNWISVLAFGYAQSAPIPDAAGSGQTMQTFTGASSAPITAGTNPTTPGGNFIVDLHDYFMCLTPGSSATSDGRQSNGEDYWDYQGGTQVGTGDSTYTTYPITGVSEATCKSQQAAFLAPYIDYTAANDADAPLMIGEWGWNPVDQTSGAVNYVNDQLAAWSTANAAIEMQWDYNVNQSQDPWATDPGTSAAGTGTDGWQLATDAFFSTS